MKNLDAEIYEKLNSKITRATLEKLKDLKHVIPRIDVKTKEMIWREILTLEETYGNFDFFVSYLHVHHVKRKKEKLL